MSQSLTGLNPKIFIGGDSWGCGEWNEFAVSHCGIEQYFTDKGYDVINTSAAKSSNRDSSGRLIEALNFSASAGDIAFWIQSDPMRDYRITNNVPISNMPVITKFGSIRSCMRVALSDNYNNLATTAEKLKVTINLIGGLSAVNIDLIDSAFLCPLVPSWCELLVGQMPEYCHFFNNLNYPFAIVREKINLKEVKDTAIAMVLLEDLIAMQCNHDIFKEHIFQPDGFHPNRSGHEILFNEIRNKLSL